jgi:hypothetical protein
MFIMWIVSTVVGMVVAIAVYGTSSATVVP